MGGQGLPGSNLTGPEAIDAQSTTDITVEIYGIVYIYNPVDDQVLGTAPAEEGVADPNAPLAAAG
jgi:hypothetical protein